MGDAFSGAFPIKGVCLLSENRIKAGTGDKTRDNKDSGFILKPDKKLEKLFIAQGASGFYETA